VTLSGPVDSRDSYTISQMIKTQKLWKSFFLGLVPISSGTAIDLHILLMNYLESVGLTDAICSKQLVGFCSDGASTMIGNYRGVATLLKEKFPRVQSFHCMAHRLELAIKNAVDSVNGVYHFKIFIDSLYKFYSLSPKNQRELASIAADTNTVLLKINKIFEVRWAFSSFLSMKALLRDYCALYAHLLRLSENGDRWTKEASKCKGLANKMSSWIFVSQLCMLKDSLRTLKQLSLFFQSNDANLVSATMKIAQAKASLLAMKDFPGKSLKNMWDMCDSTGSFKGVLLKRTDTDFANFTSLRSQFYQCLLDNIAERFPCTETLKLANVLNPTSWPTDDLQKTLYGCREVAALCKQLCFSSIASVEILSDFATFKDNLKVGMHLKQLLTKLSIYPISSADCERGFSSMNLQHTDTRNRLKTETVSALLMIAANGPAVQFFKCHEYVLSWFKKGRHGANDKQTGKKRNVDELRPRYKLFAMIKD
jgi:hypothetical protein